GSAERYVPCPAIAVGRVLESLADGFHAIPAVVGVAGVGDEQPMTRPDRLQIGLGRACRIARGGRIEPGSPPAVAAADERQGKPDGAAVGSGYGQDTIVEDDDRNAEMLRVAREARDKGRHPGEAPLVLASQDAVPGTVFVAVGIGFARIP